MTQVVHLAAGALVGEDLQHLGGDRDGDLLDLFTLLAVFGIRADVIAVPLGFHALPAVIKGWAASLTLMVYRGNP